MSVKNISPTLNLNITTFLYYNFVYLLSINRVNSQLRSSIAMIYNVQIEIGRVGGWNGRWTLKKCYNINCIFTIIYMVPKHGSVLLS